MSQPSSRGSQSGGRAEQAFPAAAAFQEHGQLRAAERLYRPVLAVEPGHLGALCRPGAIRAVRQPIFRSSVGRWLPYRDFPGPLLQALEPQELHPETPT